MNGTMVEVGTGIASLAITVIKFHDINLTFWYMLDEMALWNVSMVGQGVNLRCRSQRRTLQIRMDQYLQINLPTGRGFCSSNARTVMPSAISRIRNTSPA